MNNGLKTIRPPLRRSWGGGCDRGSALGFDRSQCNVILFVVCSRRTLESSAVADYVGLFNSAVV